MQQRVADAKQARDMVVVELTQTQKDLEVARRREDAMAKNIESLNGRLEVKDRAMGREVDRTKAQADLVVMVKFFFFLFFFFFFFPFRFALTFFFCLLLPFLLLLPASSSCFFFLLLLSPHTQEQRKVKALEDDIHVYAQEAAKQRKLIYQLEKERERLGSDAAEVEAKYHTVMDDVKLKEMQITDMGKKVTESEQKLKQQQQLYVTL